MVRNRDSGTTCCCGPQGEWTQFRKCTDGTLAPLWGLPDAPDEVFPWYMWYKGDKKCYYRDGTEPTSTSPIGAIIYPSGPPSFGGDYWVLPAGQDCAGHYCNPTPCDACATRTPLWYMAVVTGVTVPTACYPTGLPLNPAAKSLGYDPNGTWQLLYADTCAWGATQLPGYLSVESHNEADCSDPNDSPLDYNIFITCDITATRMRAWIGTGNFDIFYGETATHDCMDSFTLNNTLATGWNGTHHVYGSGGSITLNAGPPFD